MHCKEVKHIIDQVIDREIPQEALSDLTEHIDSCAECKKYLDESMKLISFINGYKTIELNEPFFAGLEDKLNRDEVKAPFWQTFLLNPSFRSLGLAVSVLIFAILGAAIIYHLGIFSDNSYSDRKLEASIRKIPEGAVLMRTADGEEVIFLDPAMDSSNATEEVIQELEKMMKRNSDSMSDGFSFASADANN